MGKGWAKGLTAATDARVAHAAAAHRGMQYTRRTPIEQCRYQISSKTTLALEWSPEMAYIVGLTATDGCLFSGRRKINFKSKDRELVATYLGLLGRTNRIKTQRKKDGGIAYFTEFHDSKLYEWFRSVGLTPRKSLTLGGMSVPDKQFVSLVRGLLDGDGGISNFEHAPTVSTYPNYRYERLWTFFNSASVRHLKWLRSRIARVLNLHGRIERLSGKKKRRHQMYRLKFGNIDSVILLSAIYADERAPRLERKALIWSSYRDRKGFGAAGGT